MTGKGGIETKEEVTGRGVIKEGLGEGLKPKSDIDKVKHFIRLKKASETAQWIVGFNILDVALLEVGKALWDRPCPQEDRAKLWETVQQWVLSKLLTREQPTEEELTWLLEEELDPWELDPSEQEHLQSELRSLFGVVKSLLTSTTNLVPVPEWKGPRLLPLLRRGVYWASYTSFTAQEREEQRRLHQLLCHHSKEVSEKLSAGALDDLSRLVDELGPLRNKCDKQTEEVVDRVKWTLDRKGPELKEEVWSRIPHEGTPMLTKRRPKPGLLESVPLLEDCEGSQTSLVSGRIQSGDFEEGSRSQSRSLQQKQADWKSGLLDPETSSKYFDDGVTVLISSCDQGKGMEEKSKSRSGRLQKKLKVWKSDHEWTGCARNVLSRLTGFRVPLWLAAVLFIVTVGLTVHIIALKGSQSSEQPQTKGAKSDAAADGKDGDVLSPCGDDWIFYRNKCYYFSEDEGTWTEAKDSCAALHSSLALIDTRKELDFMLRYKGYRDHWIGLQRETDQDWKWVNGTEFNNWFAVEDFSECAYLNHERVKSTECYGKCKWICTKVPT